MVELALDPPGDHERCEAMSVELAVAGRVERQLDQDTCQRRARAGREATARFQATQSA